MPDTRTMDALLERIVGVYAPDTTAARAAITRILTEAFQAGARDAYADMHNRLGSTSASRIISDLQRTRGL
jgi:UDP:flavonoid glycosyltransferase YjiC (YdhE family)